MQGMKIKIVEIQFVKSSDFQLLSLAITETILKTAEAQRVVTVKFQTNKPLVHSMLNVWNTL
jgi:hypothetical protein